jgi:hypothetical protein
MYRLLVAKIQRTITTSKDAIFRHLPLSLSLSRSRRQMNTNQCAHTVDTYKLVSIPPEKKKEAQPRREKNMQKQIVTKKKKLQKIRKLKATKQI